MNTILKLTTLGTLLACAGLVSAQGDVPNVNPQPLPPIHESRDAGAGSRDAVNPQPLPPRVPHDDFRGGDRLLRAV